MFSHLYGYNKTEMKIIVCLCCFTYFVEWSVCQSTTQINLYYQGTKILRESYSVKEKNNAIKSGDYKLYSKEGKLLLSGQYTNNFKSGEWNTYHDDGGLKLISVYDNGTLISETKCGIWVSTEKKGKVRKVIDYSKSPVPQYYFDIKFKYPALARENGIQGFVNLEINTDNHCNIKSMIVKDSIGYGCEKEVIIATRELIKYKKRYQIDSCRNLNKIIPFNFNLSK